MESIKDFLLKPETGEETKTEEKKKKATKIDYEIVAVSGPDFVIRRKTPKTSMILAIIPSQESYYIKNEKTGEINQLTDAGLAEFLKGLDGKYSVLDIKDANGVESFWVKKICKERNSREGLLRLLHSNLIPLVCQNLLSFGDEIPHNWYMFLNDSDVNVIRLLAKECTKYVDRECVKIAVAKYLGCIRYECYGGRGIGEDTCMRKVISLFQSMLTYSQDCSIYQMLEQRYGFDGVKKIIAAYFDVPMTEFPSIRLAMLFKRKNCKEEGTETIFERESFIQYLFYSACEQGYDMDINNFLTSWSDTLNMQMAFYGKIVDKYPENLASYEHRLSSKYAKIKAEIDRQRFDDTVEILKKYEYHGKEYSIICPKCPEDMISEGQQMSNCVASYINSMLDGTDYIFFLRKTENLEESFVTIEVLPDKTLGQVKAKFNRRPDADALAFVRKWHAKKFLAEQDETPASDSSINAA